MKESVCCMRDHTSSYAGGYSAGYMPAGLDSNGRPGIASWVMNSNGQSWFSTPQMGGVFGPQAEGGGGGQSSTFTPPNINVPPPPPFLNGSGFQFPAGGSWSAGSPPAGPAQGLQPPVVPSVPNVVQPTRMPATREECTPFITEAVAALQTMNAELMQRNAYYTEIGQRLERDLTAAHSALKAEEARHVVTIESLATEATKLTVANAQLTLQQLELQQLRGRSVPVTSERNTVPVVETQVSELERALQECVQEKTLLTAKNETLRKQKEIFRKENVIVREQLLTAHNKYRTDFEAQQAAHEREQEVLREQLGHTSNSTPTAGASTQETLQAFVIQCQAKLVACQNRERALTASLASREATIALMERMKEDTEAASTQQQQQLSALRQQNEAQSDRIDDMTIETERLTFEMTELRSSSTLLRSNIATLEAQVRALQARAPQATGEDDTMQVEQNDATTLLNVTNRNKDLQNEVTTLRQIATTQEDRIRQLTIETERLHTDKVHFRTSGIQLLGTIKDLQKQAREQQARNDDDRLLSTREQQNAELDLTQQNVALMRQIEELQRQHLQRDVEQTHIVLSQSDKMKVSITKANALITETLANVRALQSQPRSGNLATPIAQRQDGEETIEAQHQREAQHKDAIINELNAGMRTINSNFDRVASRHIRLTGLINDYTAMFGTFRVPATVRSTDMQVEQTQQQLLQEVPAPQLVQAHQQPLQSHVLPEVLSPPQPVQLHHEPLKVNLDIRFSVCDLLGRTSERDVPFAFTQTQGNVIVNYVHFAFDNPSAVARTSIETLGLFDKVQDSNYSTLVVPTKIERHLSPDQFTHILQLKREVRVADDLFWYATNQQPDKVVISVVHLPLTQLIDVDGFIIPDDDSEDYVQTFGNLLTLFATTEEWHTLYVEHILSSTEEQMTTLLRNAGSKVRSGVQQLNQKCIVVCQPMPMLRYKIYETDILFRKTLSQHVTTPINQNILFVNWIQCDNNFIRLETPSSIEALQLLSASTTSGTNAGSTRAWNITDYISNEQYETLRESRILFIPIEALLRNSNDSVKLNVLHVLVPKSISDDTTITIKDWCASLYAQVLTFFAEYDNVTMLRCNPIPDMSKRDDIETLRDVTAELLTLAQAQLRPSTMQTLTTKHVQLCSKDGARAPRNWTYESMRSNAIGLLPRTENVRNWTFQNVAVIGARDGGSQQQVDNDLLIVNCVPYCEPATSVFDLPKSTMQKLKLQDTSSSLLVGDVSIGTVVRHTPEIPYNTLHIRVPYLSTWDKDVEQEENYDVDDNHAKLSGMYAIIYSKIFSCFNDFILQDASKATKTMHCNVIPFVPFDSKDAQRDRGLISIQSFVKAFNNVTNKVQTTLQLHRIVLCLNDTYDPAEEHTDAQDLTTELHNQIAQMMHPAASSGSGKRRERAGADTSRNSMVVQKLAHHAGTAAASSSSHATQDADYMST